MSERFYISDAQIDLHYKDRRSVRRWCHNNNVRILSDTGSNRQYVLKDEYEKAKSRNYYKAQELPNSSMNSFSQHHNTIKKKKLEYIPRFENEKRMLSRLQKLIPTI